MSIITIDDIEKLPIGNNLFFEYIIDKKTNITLIGFEKYPHYILINYSTIEGLNFKEFVLSNEFKIILKIYIKEINCEINFDENWTLDSMIENKKLQFTLIDENFGEIDNSLYGIYGSPLLLYYIYLYRDYDLALISKKIFNKSLQSLPSLDKYLLAIEWNNMEELNLELYMNYLYLQTLININQNLFQIAKKPTLEDLFNSINFKYNREEDSNTNKRRLYKSLRKNLKIKESKFNYNDILKIIENLK